MEGIRNNLKQSGTTVAPVREYKDRVFRMIFKEKKEFLELYNAMNGTDYHDENDLVVTTLENAIYVGMKNDVSFMLYDQLSLYEHQSTQNSNMPLRDLFYVADVYSALTRNEDLYGSLLVKIPEPRFVVFYNGISRMPDQKELRLSDAYLSQTKDPALELKVLVLNINEGFNSELMEKCQTLKEYMMLVSRIRKYSREVPFAKAVETAVDECIREGILSEFLKRNRSEVIKVGIYEYNEELHLQKEREQGIIVGMSLGELRQLVKQICRKLSRGQQPEQIAEALEESEERVRSICRAAQPFAPDYPLQAVWEAVKEAHNSEDLD